MPARLAMATKLAPMLASLVKHYTPTRPASKMPPINAIYDTPLARLAALALADAGQTPAADGHIRRVAVCVMLGDGGHHRPREARPSHGADGRALRAPAS